MYVRKEVSRDITEMGEASMDGVVRQGFLKRCPWGRYWRRRKS